MRAEGKGPVFDREKIMCLNMKSFAETLMGCCNMEPCFGRKVRSKTERFVPEERSSSSGTVASGRGSADRKQELAPTPPQHWNRDPSEGSRGGSTTSGRDTHGVSSWLNENNK
jgi:hypothetical protein